MNCSYGCGREARFQMTSGKWCCSSFYAKCPEIRRKNSLKNKGTNNGMFGRKHSDKTVSLFSKQRKGIKKKTSKSGFKQTEECIRKRVESRKKFSLTEAGKKETELRRQRMLNGKSAYMNTIPRNPDKIKKIKEKLREKMLNGMASYMNSFIKNPSRPQVELYNRVKELYPNVILNYPCLNYSLDIAIPELRICIESDGSWWHQDKEKDLKRQKNIEKEGWKIIRYLIDNIKQVPSKIQIENDLKNIICKK